ncbi:MAG TPA: family 16 glycoside hydrolase [Gemmataceae bacterium]|jgi:serine/threonine protein kinase
MAVQRGTHPSADVLKAFASGKLSDTSADAVVTHLDQCHQCSQQVAKTSAGPTPVTNLPPELAANQQYEILRELGRGGMGVVYLAKNKLMDRLEVLKVVNKTLLDHPGAVERFLREIRSAAKLSHANVVGAYSAVQQGELLAFAMEYVEGQDLANLVKSQGPLPVPHACYYVQQAASGLQHAHEKGMVHRDIKPQNLILAREGKRHIVKVLDFGLAKVMREKTEDTGLTGEGKMLGTPDYIAPEQTLDAAKADIRADIYSLGCTLYYLLAGRPPFSANSLGAILLAHQMQEAEALNLVRPEVPEELAAVVRKMMAKSPANRYQKPLEVVQALSPFVKQAAASKASSETQEAKPAVKTTVTVDSPSAPAVKEARKQSETADVQGSLTEGRTASVGPDKSEAIRKSRAATESERPSQQKWLIGGGAAVGVLLLALVGMWAGGVFKVKPKDGTRVQENIPVETKGPTESGGFKPLFNGKDMTGWHVESGNPAQWTVEDDAIVAKSPEGSKRNYLLTNREYADFTIRLQFMVEPDSFGAIALRAVEGENIGGNNLPDHPLIALMDPVKYKPPAGATGTAYWIQNGDEQNRRTLPTRSIPFANRTWHALEITMQADHCIARVDGNQLQDLRRSTLKSSNVIPALERTKGKIGFKSQIGTLRFRNIEIEELPAPKSEVPPPSSAPPAEKDFVQLFDGKTLNGWKTHDKQKGNWRVEKGVLIGSGSAVSHLYTLRSNYKNFHLHVQARINDGGNSGVYIRAPFGPVRPPNDPMWPQGYEAQINANSRDTRKTGSLIGHVQVSQAPHKPNQWFTMDVIAEGSHIVIKVNDKTTADYRDDKRLFTGGHIALQQADAATVVEFRKIEIKEHK